MALFNESLEGRFSQLVQRLHSMKGASPVPQVAPEIQHSIQINDELDHLSHLFLARVTRYSSGRIAQALNAANFAGVQWLNPATSGVIVQVERLLIQPTANTDNYVVATFAATIAPGTTGVSVPLDTRENPNKRSAVTNVANNNIVGLSGSRVDTPSGGSTAQFESVVCRGMILAPGTSLTVFSAVINQAVQATLVHRERAVSPAELLL